MPARAIRSSPKQLPLWYKETTSGTITYSPYIYTGRPYDQGLHNLIIVVSVPADNPDTRYIKR